MTQSIEFGLTTFGDITTDILGRPQPHAEVIRNLVEQARLADEVAVDCFGIGEHHRADFAVSAPEVLLGVIAGCTSRIRLTSAATVLGSDDPIRVFQRFSTLHAASGGRAEVILGRGWFTESFELFGHDVSRYADLFDAKLAIFAKLARHGRVSPGQAGSAFRVFPPLEHGMLTSWVAVGATPESVLRAARHELPMMLAVIGGEPTRFKPLLDLYRQAFLKLGRPVQRLGIHSSGYVAATDTRAREEYWPSYQRYRNKIGAGRGWPPIDRAKFEMEVERGSLFVGAPATLATKISNVAASMGITRFDMKFSAGDLSHDRMMSSIGFFGSEVMPLARQKLAERASL